jgi:uncharacterized protein (DUF488 family)
MRGVMGIVVIHTIGHSTRRIEELLSMLREAGVKLLVDVRRFPVSRRHPQFGKDRLAGSLAGGGIGYRHEEALGGHRTPRDGSANTAWREDAFRGYADHMASVEFQAALDRVLARAADTGVAVMCAEGDPMHCHRRLLSDFLVARGAEVRHILAPGQAQPHALHEAARLLPDGGIVYDRAGQLSLPGGRAGE